MSRAYCYRCNRVAADCLCGRARIIDNPINVIVLQHPDEKKHSKNSAIIASLCLKNYQCWTGEDFSNHEAFSQCLAAHPNTTAVVFPSQSAIDFSQYLVTSSDSNNPVSQLVFIDATWRKAKKIWALSENLHDLPALKLPANIDSNYRIRKVPGQGFLSTVEAIYFSLSLVDSTNNRYQPLLDLFKHLVDQQIKHMGETTYQKNYVNKNV